MGNNSSSGDSDYGPSIQEAEEVSEARAAAGLSPPVDIAVEGLHAAASTGSVAVPITDTLSFNASGPSAAVGVGGGAADLQANLVTLGLGYDNHDRRRRSDHARRTRSITPRRYLARDTRDSNGESRLRGICGLM